MVVRAAVRVSVLHISQQRLGGIRPARERPVRAAPEFVQSLASASGLPGGRSQDRPSLPSAAECGSESLHAPSSARAVAAGSAAVLGGFQDGV